MIFIVAAAIGAILLNTNTRLLLSLLDKYASKISSYKEKERRIISLGMS